ncbi:MAG: GNAT family N-acetyltransferase [Phycisphaerales bacterium]|nr:GNAT family N-acetyltransferase [Phycisphaerales bacterium]
MWEIVEAQFPQDVVVVRSLFWAYGESLDFDLCFQGFDEELDTLPGAYAAPRGRVLLARGGGVDAGCVAVRPLGDDACEMKRLFVLPAFRGHGLGRRLAETIVSLGRQLGYARMRLDTVPEMTGAIGLYRALGFREIGPYCENPIPGALYFELGLARGG